MPVSGSVRTSIAVLGELHPREGLKNPAVSVWRSNRMGSAMTVSSRRPARPLRPRAAR